MRLWEWAILAVPAALFAALGIMWFEILRRRWPSLGNEDRLIVGVRSVDLLLTALLLVLVGLIQSLWILVAYVGLLISTGAVRRSLKRQHRGSGVIP